MKTTIEIPDSLFRKAKAHAASRGISLKQLFTEALTERIRRPERERGQPNWRRLSGGLKALHRETARVRARIEEEFEVVDDEGEDR